MKAKLLAIFLGHVGIVANAYATAEEVGRYDFATGSERVTRVGFDSDLPPAPPGHTVDAVDAEKVAMRVTDGLANVASNDFEPTQGDFAYSNYTSDASSTETSAEHDGCCHDNCCGSGCCGSSCCGSGCGCGCGDGCWVYHPRTPWEWGPLMSAPVLYGSAPIMANNPRLQNALAPCAPFYFGGWVAAGYHNNNTRQSFVPNDLLSYNDLPDRLNLHQAWLYFGRVADGSGGLDFGWRADIMYGTDAQSLQANGSPAAQTRGFGPWDASLDHWTEGWAIPQMYGEVAVGDLNIVGGYFLTPIGFETSTAPDRFFYSRSLTMFNSEPFTHTGVLASYSLPYSTVYSGWTTGWDAAFDSFLGGSAYLGGFSMDVNDFMILNYFFTAGDFGWRGDDGYNHSIVLFTDVTDRVGHVFQSDYVRHNNSFGTPGLSVEEYGINQHFYYTINETYQLGGRVEWWRSNAPTGTYQSYNEITGGVNIRPASNVVFRPEIRYDWTPGEDNFAANQLITPLVGPRYNEWTFGVDCVITY